MFFNKFLTTLFLLVFSTKSIQGILVEDCECGLINNGNNRIIGGWETSPHQFPWLVPIFNRNKLYCGGAIINNLYILTAGHCIRWSNVEDVEIKVGIHDQRIDDPANTFHADEFILHPDFFSYELYDENDIALIKVNRSIQFSQNVRPICLPKPESNYANEFAVVAGWGKTGEDRKIAHVLQETVVQVLSDRKCAENGMEQYITPTVMCAYYKDSDSCQGDSGGPLVFEREPGKMEQIGIVSWGIGCGSTTPGMYTKITKFLDWIYSSTYDGVYCRND